MAQQGAALLQRDRRSVAARRRVVAAACAVAIGIPGGIFGTGVAGAAPSPGSGQPVAPGKAATASEAQEAARTGKRVEIVGERTETTQTFVNPNGTVGRTQSLVPIRVKNRDGSWASVDTRLHRSSVDGMVVPVRTVGGVRLSGGGTGPLARLTDRDGSRELTVSWAGKLPKPKLDGDTAIYPNVLPNVDLRVRVDAEGFSHVLVVKDRAAAANPALRRLEFPVATKGVTVKPAEQGRLAATDAAGKSVFSAPKPMMWDSSGPEGDDVRERATGPGQARNTAAMPTTVNDGGVALTPDAPMLQRAETRYPVFIDPSWRVDNPSPRNVGWTHVDAAYPSQDYSSHWDSSNATTMPVGPYTDGGRGLSRSFVRFDTSWAAGKRINTARLQTSVASGYRDCASSREVEVYSSDWPGGAAAWNSQPSFAAQYSSMWVKSPRCGEATGVESDVTGAIQSAAANSSGAQAFALKVPGAAESAWDVSYRFKFNPDDTTLYVEFNSYPNEPTELSAENKGCAATGARPYLPTRRPTLRGRVSDPDGGLLSAEFTVDRYDGSSNWPAYPGAGGTRDNVASGSVGDWTVPVDLPDGLYSWDVKAIDDVGSWRRFPDWCYFRIDATPPPPAKSVTSSDYPNDDQLHGGVGQTGNFRIVPPDTDDIASYVVTVNDNQPSKGREFTANGDGTATVQVTPPQEATNTLYVWARDRAGNLADATKPYVYQFKAGPATAHTAHWTMNDASGATTKDIVGGRVATLSGGVSRDQGVLRFDGTTGVATTEQPVVATTGSFTVSAWIRLADDSRTQTILGQGGSQTDAVALRFVRDGDNRQLEYRLLDTDAVGSGGWSNCRQTAPALGVWTHVVLAYDTALPNIQLHVNGSNVCGGKNLHAPFNATGPLHLGYGLSGGSRAEFFAGDLDDVRVWNRVVYPRELPAIAAAGDGLLARWDLDENSGMTVADTSGRGVSATASGGVSWTAGHEGGTDRALHLDGTGTVASAGRVLRTDRSYTVAARVRLAEATKSAQPVISQDGTSVFAFRMGYSNLDRWVLSVANVDDSATTTTWVGVDQRPVVGEWTHLTGVYDAAAKKIMLYVNGTLVATTSTTISWNATGPLRIGACTWAGTPSNWLTGDVDDVRVYSGALPADDIALLAAG